MYLTDLADNLRAYTAPDGSKLTVIETDGWKNRTYDSNGMAGNVGVLWHHTATASVSTMTSGAPTLSMCMNGRSDLPGPLANIVFGRGGEIYIVAAGQANHAGRGSIDGTYENMGNYYLIGIEMESAGTYDDWTEAQRRVAPYLGAALDEAYSGGGIYYQVGHKEYSYEGKIDPAYWDMDTFRNEINDILAGTAPAQATSAESETAMLDEKIKNELTGGWTTTRTEIGWLPKNFQRLMEGISNIRLEVFNQKILKQGVTQPKGETTSLGLEVSYLADNFKRLFNSATAIIQALARVEKNQSEILARLDKLNGGK
ncbi:N-acetylmuramoyl-L-alanine amidase [Rothia sp. LK2588]|uniref:N-acetylmuramoyl-L-alanine amidase n=1 Tax=Rothia sp. LK2588 TaxID=3114369 RepID=UPI0034CFEF29